MNVSQLRREVKSLIKKGAADYQQRVGDPTTTAVMTNLKTGETESLTVRHRSVAREEFRRTYGDARDLLLKYGFEKDLDPKIQALYADLIPDSSDLKTAKRTTLKDLRSRNEETRMAAAKTCCKAARGIGVIEWDSWPKSPIVVESIIKALSKEKSPKIAEQLIVALGGIHDRYYADRRIFPVLFYYYDSDDRQLQRAAILWSNMCKNREKWPTLIDILQSNPPQPLLLVVLRHIRSSIPVAIKRQLQPILVETSQRKLGNTARSALNRAILQTIDQRTVAAFKTILDEKKRLKTALAKSASMNTSGDRRQFLESRLFR